MAIAGAIAPERNLMQVRILPAAPAAKRDCVEMLVVLLSSTCGNKCASSPQMMPAVSFHWFKRSHRVIPENRTDYPITQISHAVCSSVGRDLGRRFESYQTA